MTKDLRKAIITRSWLKNAFNKKRTKQNWEKYKKQRNFVVKLLRRTKYEYFNKIIIKNLTDNKTFWKTIKPYFNNSNKSSNKKILSKNEEILTNPKSVASKYKSRYR